MANEDHKKKIVDTALQMFNARGCKGVTMDDIAQELHISKRTLYETFANKEDLLSECVKGMHEEVEAMHRNFFERVDEPVLVVLYMMRVNAGFSYKYQKVIDDVERYYPEIHDRFFKMHTSAFRAMVESGIMYAKDRNYLREGVDIQLAADFICDLVQRHRLSEFGDSKEYVRRINEIGFTYVRGMMTIDTINRYEEHESVYGQLFNETDNTK